MRGSHDPPCAAMLDPQPLSISIMLSLLNAASAPATAAVTAARIAAVAVAQASMSKRIWTATTQHRPRSVTAATASRSFSSTALRGVAPFHCRAASSRLVPHQRRVSCTTLSVAPSACSVAHHRGLATSSSSSSSYARSQALAAHFVPFRLTLSQAQDAYMRWANGQPLAPAHLKSLAAIHHTDQAYLPFYAYDVEVASRFGGRVGHNSTRLVYNPRTNSWQTQTVTNWKRIMMERDPSHVSYSSDLPQCQIYAAFKYKCRPHTAQTRSSARAAGRESAAIA